MKYSIYYFADGLYIINSLRTSRKLWDAIDDLIAGENMVEHRIPHSRDSVTHHRTKFIYKEENLYVVRLVGADFFAVSNQFSIPEHIQMASTNVFIILIVCLSISQVKCNFWVGHGKLANHFENSKQILL